MGEIVKARHKGAPPTEPVEVLLAKADEALAGNDLDGAERLYGQATVAKPSSVEAWYGKGRVFALQEEWDKALRCFSIATKFGPKIGSAWLGLAACYLHLEDKAKANDALARAEAAGADLERVAELRAASTKGG